MKKYVFNLKTKSNLVKPLINELKLIANPACYSILNENKSDLKIQTDNKVMLDILTKSRLIDNVQLEIIKASKAE
jgi:hypothetical protein